MLRPLKAMVTAAALSSAAISPLASDAGAAQAGVKAGWLKCEVAGNMSFIFGSSRNMTCFYEPDASKRADWYVGTIKKFGLDLGYETAGVIIWGAIAPTSDVGAGALAGDYGEPPPTSPRIMASAPMRSSADPRIRWFCSPSASRGFRA